MKNIMLCEKNPVSGDWLCWIPNTPQAYFYSTKKAAFDFCNNVNRAFENGELKFDEFGKVVTNKLQTT